MKIEKTKLSPWQNFQILVSLAVTFAAAIVYFKSEAGEKRGLVKIKRVLTVPKIKVSREVSLDDLLKKARSKSSGENVVDLNSSDEDFFEEETPKPLKEKASSKASPVSRRGARVDLNTADFDELLEIDGMTSATAKSIINYREKMGDIWELDELKGLPGINETFLKRIKNKVTLE